MTENDLKERLLDFEEPLREARDMIFAAWMSAAEITDNKQRSALRSVLDVARRELQNVQEYWEELVKAPEVTS